MEESGKSELLESDLNAPLLIPRDNYSYDIVRGVPGSVTPNCSMIILCACMFLYFLKDKRTKNGQQIEHKRITVQVLNLF